MAATGFLSHYLCGPTPNNRKHNVLNASLNKTHPSSLPSFLLAVRPTPFKIYLFGSKQDGKLTSISNQVYVAKARDN